jgi:hypothetical protein
MPGHLKVCPAAFTDGEGGRTGQMSIDMSVVRPPPHGQFNIGKIGNIYAGFRYSISSRKLLYSYLVCFMPRVLTKLISIIEVDSKGRSA